MSAARCLSDLNLILYQGRLLRPQDTVRFFQDAMEAFSRSIQQTACPRIVVLTHHAPSRRSISPRFAGDALNPCFVSEVIEKIHFAKPVALWLHGHVHDAFDYELNGTRVVCNPLGYLGGVEGHDFDGGKLVEV